MNRWIVYVEGKQHSDHGTFKEATTEAQGMAPATIQESRTGTTPGSRRRTWIVKGVTEDQPVYMGGQDPAVMNWRVVHCSDPEGLDARNFDPGLADVPDIRHDDGMAHTATHTAQEHIMTSTKTIRCGNCKGTHGSVQEVRDCHAGVRRNSGLEGQILSATNGSITDADVAFARTASSPQRTSGVVATEKQVAFLRSLILERPTWAASKSLSEGTLESLTKAEASAAIKAALEVPKETSAKAQAAPAKDAFEDVPAGYYAVTSLSGANDLDFYSVDRPTEGRWAGYVFVKQVVGGKPEFPVKGAKWAKVLKAIQDAGWQEAARLYGQEIGRCGKCNRTLTDDTSRQLGIGPVCREQGF